MNSTTAERKVGKSWSPKVIQTDKKRDTNFSTPCRNISIVSGTKHQNICSPTLSKRELHKDRTNVVVRNKIGLPICPPRSPLPSPLKKATQKGISLPSSNKVLFDNKVPMSPRSRILFNKSPNPSKYNVESKQPTNVRNSHMHSLKNSTNSSPHAGQHLKHIDYTNVSGASKCAPSVFSLPSKFTAETPRKSPSSHTLFNEEQTKQRITYDEKCSNQNVEMQMEHQSKILAEHKAGGLATKTEVDDPCQISIMDSSLMENNLSINMKWSNQVSSTVIVAVRVRPFTAREKADDHVHRTVTMNGNAISVAVEGSHQYTFSFDHCLWSFDSDHPLYASQAQVYQVVAAPLLQHAFEGYNTCLFAYGQTGSGKSYTIMGNSDNEGVIPRFCKQLFDRAKRISEDNVTCLVEVSYFEIYNEKIYDLLTVSEEDGKKKTLRIREHPARGPYVEDLSTYTVSCYDDLKGWLELGNKQRATASTAMNDHSSRSHSIFMITLTQSKIEKIKGEDHEHNIISHINIVDLAGNERVATAQTSGERLKEGVSINKSLLTLGKVIAQLADQSSQLSSDTPKKPVFISYRESVLTWLLKESLGGNSYTVMVATISPSNYNMDETLSSLRYATQARRIINRARVNEDPKARLIKELQAEIEKLRVQNKSLPQNYEVYEKETLFLKRQLTNLKTELDQSKKSWQERLELAESKMKEENEKLQKKGIALEVKEVTPWLINLNKDPQLSETVIYLLQPGQKTVGKFHDNSTADIQLHGNLISKEHCSFYNNDGTVTVVPLNDASVFVNGCLVNKTTILHHGDRVVLGGDQFFRFHNPCEPQPSQDIKNFDYAYQEIVQIEEARMKEELAESREKTCKKVAEELEDFRQEVEWELSFRKQSFEEQSDEQPKTENSSITTKPKGQPSILDEIVPWKSTLVEWMTETFPDVFSNINHAKEELKTISTSDHTEEEGSLYELSLKLKEANQLAKQLKFNVELSQCHILTDNGLEQAVRVQKNDLGIVTYWNLSDFANRLERLHKLNEVTASSEDDLFDVTDVWDKESNTLSHLHPGSALSKKLQEVQAGGHASKLGSISVLSSSSNSPFSSRAFNFHQSSGAFSTTCLSLDRHEVVSTCFALMAEQVNEISDWTEDKLSVIDPVIDIFGKLLSCVAELKEFVGKSSDHITRSCIKLMGVFNHLQAAMYYVLTHWTFQTEQSYFGELISKSEDKSMTISAKESIFQLAKSIAFMFQGIEKCVDSLVVQYSKKAMQAVLNLVLFVGRVSIDVHAAPNWRKIEKHSDMTNAIVQGADKHVSLILNTAIAAIHNISLQLDVILEDSFFGPIWNSRYLLHCTKDILRFMETWFNKCIMWKDSWVVDGPHEKYTRFMNISESVMPTIDLLRYLVDGIELIFKGSVNASEMSKLLKVLRSLENNLLLVNLSPSSKFAMSGRLEVSRKDAINSLCTLKKTLKQFNGGLSNEDSFMTLNSTTFMKKSSEWNTLQSFSTEGELSQLTASSCGGDARFVSSILLSNQEDDVIDL